MTPSPQALQDAAHRTAVFLPNYNHGQFLAAALNGLVTQSFVPGEICVVDDASTDESRAIIAGYSARYPVIKPVLLDKRRGVIANMNTFLQGSKADFLYFAASDDIVMPTLIERSLTCLLTHPKAGLCSSLVRLMDENGKDIGPFLSFVPKTRQGFISPKDAGRILLKFDSWIMGNTSVYRRQALLDAGGFDPTLKGFTDGFAQRVIALKYGVCFLDEELAYWRRLDTGFSSTTSKVPKTVHDVAHHALAHMHAEGQAVFPPAYPARWRRRWIYGAASRCLQTTPQVPWEDIAAICAPLSTVDRTAITLCRKMGKTGQSLFKVYLALRLRSADALRFFGPCRLASHIRRRRIAARWTPSARQNSVDGG